MTGLRIGRFLSSLVTLLVLGVHAVEDVGIKIVEAPTVARYPSWPSTSQSQLVLRTQPNPISGPPHLQQLAGQCFEASQQGYTYRVCPFHNVTQREERVSWNSFHGVLGVWKEWLVDNDTFFGLQYSMGEACSSSDREAKVLFNCSTVTRLHNITEPSACNYVLWMDTPLACFKGAMQVYHVLSEQQLREWEALDVEYHSDEITFQGLAKKRRRLLTQAKLFQQFTEEKQPADESKADVDEAKEADSEAPLAQCEKERTELQRELSDLRGKIADVMREHPSIHFDSDLQSLLQPEDQGDDVAVDVSREDELAQLANEEALDEQLALLDDSELRELMED